LQKKAHVGIMIIFFSIVLASGFFKNERVLAQNKSELLPEKEIEPYSPPSSSGVGEENPIFINGSATGVGAHNWTWVQAQPWFGGGTGVKGDPYRIENLTINGNETDSCLEIIYSSVHVLIKNLTLSNASASNAGIKLNWVFNCSIEDCHSLSNQGYGIRMENSQYNIIRGNNITDNNRNGMYIRWSHNNTITGNTITEHYGYEGLYLVDCDNISFTNNNISRNADGIYLTACDDGLVEYNNVSDNDNGYNDIIGIYVSNCDNMTIIRNNVSKHSGVDGGGIKLSGGNDNTVKENTLEDNFNGIYLEGGQDQNVWNNNVSGSIWGIRIQSNTGNNVSENQMENCGIVYFNPVTFSSNQIDDLNTVNGKPVYYYKSKNSLGPSNFSNAGQVILLDCNDSLVSGVDCSNASIGISLHYSNNNTVLGNSADYNLYGIYLKYSTLNTIKNNILDYTWDYGIYVYFSDNNTITGNTITNTDLFGINGINSDYLNISGNNLGLNNRGYYHSGCDNLLIENNTCYGNIEGIYFTGGQNISVIGNNLTANQVGLHNKGSYCNVSDNSIEDNLLYGIHLENGYNCTIERNQFNNNSYGIYIEKSDYHTVRENSINFSSLCGIYLIDGSDGSSFYNNSFYNYDRINAFDNCLNNEWSVGGVGNYWYDYSGKDSNDDSIGDSPYSISGTANSIDSVPIWWDPPMFSILSPTQRDTIGEEPPEVLILITDGLVNYTWYSIDTGDDLSDPIFFTGTTITIDTFLWEELAEGSLIIHFYANDSRGEIGYTDILLTKLLPTTPNTDTTPFIIIIILITSLAGVALVIGLVNFRKSKKKILIQEAEINELGKLKDKITEEDIILSKERRICLVHKGPSEGIIYVCPECSAVYCFKCYEAIKDLENECWSCGNPMDSSKPVKKQFEGKEVGIIPEIEDKSPVKSSTPLKHAPEKPASDINEDLHKEKRKLCN